MAQFLKEDFLLNTEVAKELYFGYAKDKPIIDYHCHVSPKEIYEDKRFENITELYARTGRPFRRRGCGFRRIWRKWLGFVKNPIFSLAFFGRNGYTSVINNLLSGLRNNYYK